jgi:hypothetical protein
MRAGYVTEFEAEDAFISRHEPHMVGSRKHVELWVPAEELADFNTHILAKIRIIEAYFGDGFTQYLAERFGLAGKDAPAQVTALVLWLEYSSRDVWMEIAANRLAIFLRFPFWTQRGFELEGISSERKKVTLQFSERAWTERYPDTPLCCATTA